MHRALLLCVAVALGCGGSTPDGDAGPGAGVDAGRPLRDAGCGPVGGSGSGPECVMDTCFGGLTCVNGPCPYPCCMDGRLEVCELQSGYECNVAPPMDCGGGACVQPGQPCP